VRLTATAVPDVTVAAHSGALASDFTNSAWDTAGAPPGIAARERRLVLALSIL
jgi:hypothetical protein